MLDIKELKHMKLEVFEDASQGKISDNMKKYLLTYLESVISKQENIKKYNEYLEESVQGQKDTFVEYVIASFEEGLITEKQRDAMLNLSENVAIYEAVSPDNIGSLLNAFVEATDNGDVEAQAEIREKLSRANEMKTLMEGGKDCGEIEAKLKELEIDLTDDEKKVVQALDKKICDAQNSGDEKEDSEDGEEKKDGEEEVKESGTEGETPGQVAAQRSGAAKYNANEKRMENEQKAKVKKVVADAPKPSQAPLSDDTTSVQSSVHLKGAIAEFAKESVENGLYTQAEMDRVSKYLDLI